MGYGDHLVPCTKKLNLCHESDVQLHLSHDKETIGLPLLWQEVITMPFAVNVTTSWSPTFMIGPFELEIIVDIKGEGVLAKLLSNSVYKTPKHGCVGYCMNSCVSIILYSHALP